ncbi:hypothetical protein BHE74_00001249 [Ensete ventricosum]|nr:hypothetical protein GW17_00029246 [Ensete ventricosum]RWW89716.1 hypothetical protein BHE74_00001249 [Ensete ventricosum]RZR89243.1 hypothetical protein BHM03_00016935 [Ensete ventricosum]
MCILPGMGPVPVSIIYRYTDTDRLAQVRSAGIGDSLRSSMLKCLIHSAQSSVVLLCEASPAVLNRRSLT